MKKFLIGFVTMLAMGIGLARAYQTYTINGIPYLFPDVNDETWGQRVTDWAGAVTNGMLQKAGGTFTLTSEAYFGANYGLRAAYFKSKNLPVASTGAIRLANADTIRWRNINNTGDFIFQVNSSSLPVFNGYVLGFSTDISNTIFLSTSALQSNIDALYVNVSSTYTALNNRIDAAAISSTTANSRLNDLDLSTAAITSRADAVAIATSTMVDTTSSTQAKAGGFIVGGDLTSSSTVRSNMATTSTTGERFNFVAYVGSDTPAEINIKNNATSGNTNSYEYLSSSGIVGNIRFYAPYSGAGNMEYFRLSNVILNRNLGDIASQMIFWGPNVNGTAIPLGTIVSIKNKARWGIRASADPAYIPSSMFELIDGSMTIVRGGINLREASNLRVDGLSELLATTKIGSATVYGTVTSTSGFVGDGSGLYNLPARLPLAQGSTYYAIWQDVSNATAAIITRADGAAISSTTAVTRISNLDQSTAAITTRADAVAIATTAATVQKITVYSAGVFAGNVSTINFNTNLSVSVTGGTATVNASGGSGGGTSNEIYTLIIGTSSVRGATIVGNTQDAFNFAISSALTMIGGTTIPICIYVQRGSYTFTSQVFVPYNVTIKGEDTGAVCYNNNGLGVFSIEGRVTNMGFVSRAWTYSGSGRDHIIQMKWRGKFDYNTFHEGKASNGGQTVNIVISVNGSSFTTVSNNEFLNFTENSYTLYGLTHDASLSVSNANNNVFTFNKIVFSESTAAGYVCFIYSGNNNKMEYNDIYQNRKSNILMNVMAYSLTSNCFNNSFSYNRVSMDLNSTDGSGFALFSPDFYGQGISTGTQIVGNQITLRVPSAGNNLITLQTDGSGYEEGMLIADNVVISTTAGAGNFVTVNSGARRTLIKNNTVRGMGGFVSDSGTQTIYTNKNNDLNNIAQ